ncbi:aminodeoxychorismate synthase component I [Salinisphaera sp. LB1]|uniref:aminodeoxychorismate synthase component I n=1 Tax=Salinisphaera sp. LB1 TaxID=2183911 RepID=UPI000D7D7C0C|nr:aminodeoxychorismate synthase component I [Salinisphaera sp. LB1]AWN17372.1 Para-aminobenzoate synthase, aminase component [Salinisphaera sp. LB1]
MVAHDLARATLDPSVHAPLYQLARAEPGLFPALLESSAGAAAQSRYDILLADPAEAITPEQLGSRAAFFDFLDTCARQTTATTTDLPFIGGWLIYLGYEMAAGVEPGLALPPAGDGLPTALALRCRSAIIHDRRRATLEVVSENADVDRVAALVAMLESQGETASNDVAYPAIRWQEDAPEDYLDAVARAREYIRAGDVFQANLARAWHGRLVEDVSPGHVYTALRAANPAPFSALLNWQGAALVCSSPERLLSLRDGRASVRPIAGTRRRRLGRDAEISEELITHPKERAEHVMLIDLVRNDLGRVCRPGSIAVDELMVVESYAHVHHIVSNVCGQLKAGVGPGGALRAVFPGGTITGCPKVRCMQIIAELERTGRGAYTGSIGYLSRCGTLDTNIIIRSLTQVGRDLTLRTGAGIVADSDPASELAETRHKAHGVLRAFRAAQASAVHG